MSDDAKSEDQLASERFGSVPRDERIGHHLDVFAGRITDATEIERSSSGGLTTYLLLELLVRGLVDGIIHVGASRGPELFGYTVSTSADEIQARRKSEYYSTSLAEVVQRVRGDGRRYAVVGIPCFIKAARLLADEDQALADQLTYFVGLVCGHLKSQFFAESLGWQAGIAPGELTGIDFRVKNRDRDSSRYDYVATGGDNSTAIARPTQEAIDGNWAYNAFAPEACGFCDDIFAETADVVFGDAWLPRYKEDWRGTNVVVTRNTTITAIFTEARESGEIEADDLSLDAAAQSQAGNFRHRRVGLAVRLADDADAGLATSEKRIRPGRDGVSRTRIELIRQRRRMAAISLRSFAAAREASDFSLYSRPMKAAIRKYHFLEWMEKGPRFHLRRILHKTARAVFPRRFRRGLRSPLPR